ncbi:MAG: copper transporter [Corynebacterium variabile]|uniref:copper transporter n=1 Tax=Corynebacterium variabile TaxID=1727 RepID=UPI0026477DD7|nr:copper transporter [Corynebacterium variabile]MDN6535694.1 copper transporter [Corynebacterium variabile]
MSGPKILGGVAAGIAAGTLLGFYVLAPNVEGGPAAVDSDVQEQLDPPRAQLWAPPAGRPPDDAVLDEMAAGAVRDDLKDHSVRVVAMPDADQELVDAQRALLSDAGATDAGTLSLADDAVSQDKADAVKSLAANTLPAGAKLSEDRRDPGFHFGQVVGQALRSAGDRAKEASESDRSLVLGALDKSGFIDGGIPEVDSADAVVVVTGPTGGFAGTFTADLAAGLDDVTGGVVLAGDWASTTDGGALEILRADRADTEKVSTVDNADRTAGRITVVRALAQQLDGKAGSYGAAESAATPSL